MKRLLIGLFLMVVAMLWQGDAEARTLECDAGSGWWEAHNADYVWLGKGRCTKDTDHSKRWICPSIEGIERHHHYDVAQVNTSCQFTVHGVCNETACSSGSYEEQANTADVWKCVGDWGGNNATCSAFTAPPPPPPYSGGSVGGGGGGGGGGGSRTPRTPTLPRITSKAVGYLENPLDGSYVSGISLISGWVCDADKVEVEFFDNDSEKILVPYGTPRVDADCDELNVGFGLLFNWNLLGDGEHTIIVRVNRRVWAIHTFTVTTLGEEFAKGLSSECVAEDFPDVGTDTTMEWQQSLQNFVITEVE